MRYWVLIIATGFFLAMFLAFLQGARAQETQKALFCEREDEAVAIVLYGDEAVPIINRTFKGNCAVAVGTFITGKPVETVQDRHNNLWDITPVLLYRVNQYPVEPVEQWVSVASPLVSVTWIPDGSEDPLWKAWFENAQTTDAAAKRFGWRSCCSHSDRFVTQFKPSKDGEHWYYQRTDKSWIEIPDDIIHWEDDPTMPEQLKREGVLFIYQTTGQLTCFWPPQTTF